MTYKEIFTALEATGLPVAYNFWESPENVPPLPYIVFTYPDNNDYKADNTNYQEIVTLEAGLYTRNRDIETEKAVEAVLNTYFHTYFKTSEYVQNDSMQETLYTMEVIITDGE